MFQVETDSPACRNKNLGNRGPKKMAALQQLEQIQNLRKIINDGRKVGLQEDSFLYLEIIFDFCSDLKIKYNQI